jgi:hypothetical protein
MNPKDGKKMEKLKRCWNCGKRGVYVDESGWGTGGKESNFVSCRYRNCMPESEKYTVEEWQNHERPSCVISPWKLPKKNNHNKSSISKKVLLLRAEKAEERVKELEQLINNCGFDVIPYPYEGDASLALKGHGAIYIPEKE